MAKVLFEKPYPQPVITVKILWIIGLVLFSTLLGVSVFYLPFLFALGLLLVFFFSLFIFHYPYIGILVYLFITIVRPQEFLIGLAGAFGLERVMAIVVLISFLLSPKVREEQLFVRSPINWSMLGLLLVMIASTATAVWKGQAISASFDFAKTAVFYFLIINIVDTESRFKQFVWLYLLSTAFLAVASIYLYFTGEPYVRMGIQRAISITNSYGDPNSLASSLLLALPFLLTFISEERTWVKILRLMLALVLVFCVILTGSRAGFVSLIIFALLYSIRANKKLVALTACVSLLFLTWTIMPHQYQERFLTLFNPELNESATASAQGRIVGLKMGLTMFMDHPLLGVGVGNFPTAWALLYSGEGERVWMQPHNMLGQLLGELGALGLLAFIIFILITARELYRIRRNCSRTSWRYQTSRTIELGFVLLFAFGLFGHNLYRYNWYFLAALTVVLNQLVSKEDKWTTTKA